MADSSQDKTEQPTPRKLQDARKKGQVAKSKDLTAAVVLMAVVGAMYLSAKSAASGVERYLTWYFTNCLSFELPEKHAPWVLLNSFFDVSAIFMPLFIIAIILSILGNVMQTGFMFSPEAIKAKLERLNPLEGFKRIFSLNSVFEMVKN